MRDRRDAIILNSEILTNTMKVKARSVIGEIVDQVDNNGISPIGFDRGSRYGPIHGQDYPFNSIWSERCIGYLKPILVECQHVLPIGMV